MAVGNNGTANCSLSLSDASKAYLCTALIFVFVIGGAGNCLLSSLVIRHTEMRSTINILLALTAISDACISLCCCPLDLISIILDRWIFGRLVCCLHASLLSVCVVQNVTVLVVISVDRYCILVLKKNCLRGCSKITLVLGCTCFAFAVSSPPLFGMGQFAFINEHCEHVHNPGMFDVMYFALFSSFLFVLPCGLLLLAYVHIIVTLRKTTHRVRPECHNIACPTYMRDHDAINVRFKQKTFSTILYLYVASTIFKLPLAIKLLMKSVNESVTCPVSFWVLVITYMNSASNPFIYACKISTYWMVITEKFRSVKKRVTSLRGSKERSNPANVYKISGESVRSVI